MPLESAISDKFKNHRKQPDEKMGVNQNRALDQASPSLIGIPCHQLKHEVLRHKGGSGNNWGRASWRELEGPNYL